MLQFMYHESCHTGQSFSPELNAHHAADWEVSFPPHASKFAKKSGHDCYGGTFLALWQFYIMIVLRITPLNNSYVATTQAEIIQRLSTLQMLTIFMGIRRIY